MLLFIAKKLGVAPASLIMIGDGPQDIGAALSAGCVAIGVEGGILPDNDLSPYNPDVVLTSLLELPAYLEQQGI